MSAGIYFPWLRRIRVSFEGLSGAGNSVYESDGTQVNLRIIARVEKVIMGIPNASNIMMFNLSEGTRNSFQRGKTSVSIEAGWDNGPFAGLSQCFKGTLQTSSSQRAGPDIVTSITAIAAVDDLNLTPVNNFRPAGYDVATLVKELADMLPGVTVDAASIKYINRKIGEGGWTFCGSVKRALSDLAGQFGFNWSIIDQKFCACKNTRSFGGGMTIQDPYLIDINPVFIGNGIMPTVYGMRIRSIFQPAINPFDDVMVNSTVDSRFNGTRFVVHAAVHNLDCYNGNSFNTELNCLVHYQDIVKANG